MCVFLYTSSEVVASLPRIINYSVAPHPFLLVKCHSPLLPRLLTSVMTIQVLYGKSCFYRALQNLVTCSWCLNAFYRREVIVTSSVLACEVAKVTLLDNLFSQFWFSDFIYHFCILFLGRTLMLFIILYRLSVLYFSLQEEAVWRNCTMIGLWLARWLHQDFQQQFMHYKIVYCRFLTKILIHSHSQCWIKQNFSSQLYLHI